MSTTPAVIKGKKTMLTINARYAVRLEDETHLMICGEDGHPLGAIIVTTADLAAALGLVTPVELAARDEAITNLRADLREADRARDAACDTRDALRAELDEADAALARVREWRDFHGTSMTAGAREDIDAALDPKPAFTVGTIARIRVERGNTTEFPVAERVRGGWQTGVHHYPDDSVAEVLGVYEAKP